MTRALGICLAAALGSLAAGQDYSKIAKRVKGVKSVDNQIEVKKRG